MEESVRFFFDANRYSSVFSKKSVQNKEVGSQWLATWRDIDGNIRHDILYKAQTNNQAEYGSMLFVLRDIYQLAQKNQIDWLREATIYGDSQLVIYQMLSKYKVEEQGLLPLWMEAVNLVHVLRETHGIVVKFIWIRRDVNNRALNLLRKLRGDINDLPKEEEGSTDAETKASSTESGSGD
jgi:ribonuclease HI